MNQKEKVEKLKKRERSKSERGEKKKKKDHREWKKWKDDEGSWGQKWNERIRDWVLKSRLKMKQRQIENQLMTSCDEN